MVNTLLRVAIAGMAACSAISFTYANGAKGQSITNAEVQPNNTVVLKYPNGLVYIDTNPGESTTCAAVVHATGEMRHPALRRRANHLNGINERYTVNGEWRAVVMYWGE